MTSQYEDDRDAIRAIATEASTIAEQAAGTSTVPADLAPALAHAILLLLGGEYLKHRTTYRRPRDPTPGPHPYEPTML